MTHLATRECSCALNLYTGQKRPAVCVHGNRYLTDAELNPKPRKPLSRTSKLAPEGGRRKSRGGNLRRGRGFAVTEAQRAKVKGLPCVGCGREASDYVAIDPAHIWSEGSRCTDPLCIIPLCRTYEGGCHPRLDDPSDPFDLLPALICRSYFAELAHVIQAHEVSPTRLLERVTGRRWAPVEDQSPNREAVA